jgi:transcriptional regulator with XRE-family HTH domain
MKSKTKNVSRETLEQKQLGKIGQAFQTRRLALSRVDGVQAWSYSALEEKCGVSTVTLSKLERGKLTNCSLETINKIASALGMSVDMVPIVKN